MIIFKKIKEESNRFDNTEVIMKSESVTWMELVDDFKNFLRACGYVIPQDED